MSMTVVLSQKKDVHFDTLFLEIIQITGYFFSFLEDEGIGFMSESGEQKEVKFRCVRREDECSLVIFVSLQCPSLLQFCGAQVIAG